MTDDTEKYALRRSRSVERETRDALRTELRDLEEAIESLRSAKSSDPLTISRLVKRKLRLKDLIFKVEDELESDIITETLDSPGTDFAKRKEKRYDTERGNKKRNFRGSLEGDEKQLVQRSVRLSEDLLQAVEAAARESGLSQQEWMRRQFRAALEGHEQPEPAGASVRQQIDHEGLSTTMKVEKRQMNLRLEPTVFDAVVKAAEDAGVPRNDWLRAAVIKALIDGLDVYQTLEPDRDRGQESEP